MENKRKFLLSCAFVCMQIAVIFGFFIYNERYHSFSCDKLSQIAHDGAKIKYLRQWMDNNLYKYLSNTIITSNSPDFDALGLDWEMLNINKDNATFAIARHNSETVDAGSATAMFGENLNMLLLRTTNLQPYESPFPEEKVRKVADLVYLHCDDRDE